MKLYALGEGCHILTFKNTTVMLDCALDWGNQTSSWDFVKRNVIQNDPSSGTKSMLNLLNRTNRLNVNSLSSSSTKITQQDLQPPSIVFKAPNFHKIDASQIDLILITNPHNLLALPFLYQHLKEIAKDQNSDKVKMPTIYATEPTVQLGKKMMQELIAYVKQSEHLELSRASQIFKPEENIFMNKLSPLLSEKFIYSNDDVLRVVESMKSVSYQERVAVFGGVFEISALSSGYSLGYCNWLIRTEYEKIFYVSHSSRSGVQVRHPAEMDLSTVTSIVQAPGSSSGTVATIQSGVSGSMVNTVMIVSNICPKSDRNLQYFEQVYQQLASTLGPISKSQLYAIDTENIKIVKPLCHYYPEATLNDICRIIGKTIESGGDVLIPCHTTGLIYDLIDFLSTFFNSVHLGNTLIYLVSPVADHAIQYANISAEWLCDSKMDKTLTAESPFAHVNLLQNKSLVVFDSVNSKFMSYYQSHRVSNPCVIFAGHPSLRMGDILQLIPIFQRNSNNAMIMIEPEYSFLDTIEPFLPPPGQQSMKFIHCPIDLRLKNSDVVHMVKQVAPQHLILTNVAVDIPPYNLKNCSPSTELQIALNSYSASTASTLLNSLDMRTISKFVSEKIHTISTPGSSIRYGIDGDDILSIKRHHMKRKYEMATLSHNLAQTIYPKVVKGVYVSRVSAELTSKDGKHILDVTSEDDSQSEESSSKKRKHDKDLMVFGDISVEKIVKHLQVEGFDNITVLTSPTDYGTYTIVIPQLGKIIFNAEDTTIETQDETSRQYLKEVLMQNLYML
ncbi:hypothetical protein NAEGRDRAFT_80530 [Naegleria gruberi]|uniref:Beta-Casp domain-containing protein n=1 Tax=Naegleria gruberi TaxID=5762 RepID=D2VME5_NAEGR|nr:uncharacterized protein NAEGRDRAFT_80530 [Naegleria gruberi]EFC41975.1 hypothetical protein NAEGRDRAFT_80530 [Naegleria gruberi]|eukprot:XP_002674719.1 hypothetical protein NAEGRDRAFT_80530 [Naegleria gruberi strain NEG-M]